MTATLELEQCIRFQLSRSIERFNCTLAAEGAYRQPWISVSAVRTPMKASQKMAVNSGTGRPSNLKTLSGLSNFTGWCLSLPSALSSLRGLQSDQPFDGSTDRC